MVVENFDTQESGPAYSKAEDCASFRTWTLAFEVNDKPGLKVNKDVTNTKNWQYYRTSHLNDVNVECRLVITEADIVPK